MAASKIFTVIHDFRGLTRAIGVFKAGEIMIRRALRLPKAVSANLNGHVLEVRPMDSDLLVLSQIFGWHEYKIDEARFARLKNFESEWYKNGLKPLIIDAGANVGYSTIYFSDLFPNALVLAIEPDPVNFEILKRHVGNRPNVAFVNAALWSHERGLALHTTSNSSWGSFVDEGKGTPSKRLDHLVSSIENARPLIVKLDIEGAEREVVESSPGVFRDAKCIMVEPHDFMKPGLTCLFPLYKVAGDKRFDTILSGENLQLFALD